LDALRTLCAVRPSRPVIAWDALDALWALNTSGTVSTGRAWIALRPGRAFWAYTTAACSAHDIL
jgi:hypothetical protein